MTRAMNLSVSEDVAVDHCRAKGIGISALERLPGGGIRLVCMSVHGAEQLRKQFKSKLIAGDAPRTAFGFDRP